METLVFLKEFVQDTQSLFILWVASLLYFVYSLPQYFKIDIYASFSLGLFIICISAAVYPFLALSQEHYWWYGLCFLAPWVLVFFWSLLMYECNGYNGEGGLVMLVPVFILIGAVGISLAIRLARYLLA
ncbi:MAG TPA: hypothetical protein VN030_02805 [Cellvibrio sp.]|nr:hypothetical protein [Cellvibrio sp.]